MQSLRRTCDHPGCTLPLMQWLLDIWTSPWQPWTEKQVTNIDGSMKTKQFFANQTEKQIYITTNGTKHKVLKDLDHVASVFRFLKDNLSNIFMWAWTPVDFTFKYRSKVRQSWLHMSEGFHIFKPYQLSLLSTCQPSALRQHTWQGGLMSQKCEARPPPTPLPSFSTRVVSLHPLCPPEVPGQQLWRTTAQLWCAGCLFVRLQQKQSH